jgi:7-cyano-7-deazaguanine reductase
MSDYNETHAKSGLRVKLPAIEVFPNQFAGYTIRIEIPEYTAVCPKTGLPDFGTIILEYEPVKHVLELKSLKSYILAYRNIGIFYENAVNRMLHDFTAAAKPKWCRVTGLFNTRGGMHSAITAQFGKPPGVKSSK